MSGKGGRLNAGLGGAALTNALGAPIRAEFTTGYQRQMEDMLNQRTGMSQQQAAMMQNGAGDILQKEIARQITIQQLRSSYRAMPAPPTEAELIERELAALCPTLADPSAPVVRDPWWRRWYMGALKWLLRVLDS